MSVLYSVKDASAITGASRQIIRVYTTVYTRWFSTEATPEQGKERRFTAADLKLIRYIYQTVSQEKLTHEQVQARLSAGALDSFDWEESQEPPRTTQGPQSDIGTAVVPYAQLQAARLLLEDAQRREQDAIERAELQRQESQRRERELLEQLQQLQREMGKLEGEAATLRAQQTQRPPEEPRKARPWWARVFGGGE